MTLEMTRHFEAVWRLTPEGDWMEVQRAAPAASALAQVVELFASMCAESFEMGAEIVARVGERTLIARRDERGVLVGLHGAQANPMMIRTAMSRIEQTSIRANESSRRMSWSSREPAAFNSQSIPQPAPPSSSPFVATDAVEAIDFDQFLGDEPSMLAAAEPAQSVLCRWDAVADYVSRAVEAAAAMVGRTVAANYWREALRADERLAAALVVDMRGRVEAQDAERRVDAITAQGLDAALGRWTARCERVIPKMEPILSALGAPPWRR